VKFSLLSPTWNQVLRAQKMFCNSRVTITNTGQRNHVPTCTAVCVVLMAREREECVSAPVGMCVVPCFGEYHTKVNLYITPILNTVCHDKTVIQGATDLQQPELCE
jgi:hypothetical protein